MSYSDVKQVTKDITKLALNGSPYWRLAVSGCVVVLFALWYWGHITYARADDLNKVQESYIDIKTTLLSQSILSARKEQCEAIRGGRPARYWTEQVLKLKNEYWKLTGRGFEMPPSCDEI